LQRTAATLASIRWNNCAQPLFPLWNNARETNMLQWILILLLIAAVASLLGFRGVAGASAGIAKILIFIVLIVMIIALFTGVIIVA
jgi:uncharacterized membrane protein YtjA (UPF0391 family)